MALEGSLSDFGLADILQLIFFQRKTGVLTLEGKLDTVTLFFVDGNISGAESRKRIDDNRLGKILVKKGLITEDNLQSALEEQRSRGVKIGNVLIQRGLVDKQAVLDIVTGQITETVIQLFSWKQGTYEFVSKSVQPDKEMGFSLDTQHLLMEGMRIVDEWSVIRDRITLDSIFRRSDQPASLLSEEEREIYSFVDGDNDVSTIIDLSGKDNFHVSKTLLTLLDKGVVVPVESVPVADERKPKAPRISLDLLSFLPHAVVIVSLLLSLGVMSLSRSQTAKILRASEQVDSLRLKIAVYQLARGAYPSELREVGETLDPWRRSLVYEKTESGFRLLSTGPDGKEGTDDDIF